MHGGRAIQRAYKGIMRSYPRVRAHGGESHFVYLAGRIGQDSFIETNNAGGGATADLEDARRFADTIRDPIERATVWFRAMRRAEQLVEDHRSTISFLVHRWTEAEIEEHAWGGEPFDCLPGFEIRLAMGF